MHGLTVPMTDAATELAAGLIATLTWYRGSIRPYASLWHTLMRVAALNGHKAGELPGWPASLTAPQHRRRLHPLHNPKCAFNTEALAHALGEPLEVFRWSHLGALPSWMRPLVAQGFRVCLTCLDEGYHSALFSLRLLQDCPIHNRPLLERCHCGRAFPDKLTTADLNLRGCCPCGQFTFFTPEVCRVLRLTPPQTQALDAVVQWLDQLSRVVRSSAWRELAPLSREALTSHVVWELSSALGLAYPKCMTCQAEAAPPAWRSFRHASTYDLPLQTKKIRRHHPAPPRPTYWAETPANHVYKSVARYLRSHGVRHGDRWGQQFQFLPSGDEKRLLHHNPEAVPAWTEWMWAQQVEPQARERRWPYRPPGPDKANTLYGGLGPTGFYACPFTLRGASISPHSPLHIWLEYQAAGFTLLQLWRSAHFQARAGVDHILPEDATPAIEPCDWSAAQQPGGHWVFIGHPAANNPSSVGWPSLPLPNKSAREYAFRKALDKTWKSVLSVCVGPCLTWLPQAGWTVSQAAQPSAMPCRRLNLLGLPGKKPVFWVFEAGDGFVARMCGAKLQVFGGTPKEAITALRKWYPSFQSMQGVLTPSLLEQVGP